MISTLCGGEHVVCFVRSTVALDLVESFEVRMKLSHATAPQGVLKNQQMLGVGLQPDPTSTRARNRLPSWRQSFWRGPRCA